MEPGKSYAFVSYSHLDDATTALQNLHGKEVPHPELVSFPGLHLYLDYVGKVPGISIPEDQLPSGLYLIQDIVDEEMEDRILKSIDWSSQDPGMTEGSKQVLKHRRVKHYGYEFRYGTNSIDADDPLSEGIPDVCGALLDRLMSSGHLQAQPDQLTVNQYQPGQGIPAHIDTHSACEDPIVSVSLGSQVVMDFRHPDGRQIPVLLPPRSALVMSGEARYVWSHGITPRKSDIIPAAAVIEPSSSDAPRSGLTLVKRSERTSFTFRKVLPGPCCCKYPEYCDSQKKEAEEKCTPVEQPTNILPESDEQAAEMENLHVHKVYEEIANHFSSTRHTPWPRVREFLMGQPEGALVADIGCGNGKYLGINDSAFKVGCDRSFNLCGVCRDREHNVFVSDALAVPLRSRSCDVVISIAVIHHLSTLVRRCVAVKELARVLRVGGQGLIYVWAFEQERNNEKSNYLSMHKVQTKQEQTSDFPEEAGSSLNSQRTTETSATMEPKDCRTESSNVEESASAASGSQPHSPDTLAQDTSKLAIHVNRTHFDAQDLLVPWHLRQGQKKASVDADAPSEKGKGEPVFHRYYHVFQEGELESLCGMVDNVKVITSYYDKGNWCVIFERTS